MAATFRSVSSEDAFSASSQNVAKPAGTVATDVLLACAASSRGTSAQMGTPTGGATWLLLDSLDAGVDDLCTKIWWKVAGGSEPANYAFPLHTDLFVTSIAVLAISGAAITEPLHASGTAGAGTTVTTPTLTPAAADDLEVRVAAAATEGTWSGPATYTVRADQFNLAVATKELSSGAATGTQNFTADVSVTSRQGFTIDIATLIPNLTRSPVASSRSAVHRAASW